MSSGIWGQMRFRRRDAAEAFVPPVGRLTIPVLAPTGGSGRSTLTYLLAACVAEQARTLVVDTAAPLASPWGEWVTRPAGDEGAAHMVRALAGGSSVSAQRVYAAAAGVATGTGGDFSVLQAPRHAGPVVVDLFAPRVAVVDTDVSVLGALSDDDPSAPDRLPGEVPGGLGEWLTTPACAPVLCASASAKGITDLSLAVHRLRGRGLRTERIQLAVVGIAASELPRRVQAGLTLLEPYVAGTTFVPHQPRLHAVGTPSWARTTRRLRVCVWQLLRGLTTPPADDTVDAGPPSPASRVSTPTLGGTDALTHPR
jgi:hypothetical protein